MEIQTLRYILKLEECRNFSEAADYCDISQSSFSKHIQRAEDELGGVRLFDRSARPLKVTAAGREFTSYARQIVEEYDALERAMRQYSDRYQKELVVGSIPVMGALGINRLMQAFRKTLEDENTEMYSILRAAFLEHGLEILLVFHNSHIQNRESCFAQMGAEQLFYVHNTIPGRNSMVP